MSWPKELFPPLAQRLADGRPVLAKQQATELTERILGMTSADTVSVNVRHTARTVIRLANGQVLSGDDGDQLDVWISTAFGGRQGFRFKTNRLDEDILRGTIQQAETLAREGLGRDEVILPIPRYPDEFLRTQLWKEGTIRAMQERQDQVVTDIFAEAKGTPIVLAGFIGLMARSESLLTKDGISGFHEETDSELTVTARHVVGRSSGWDGRAERDWSRIDARPVTRRAIELAKRGVDPVALEPGRRMAILGPAAVLQMMRWMAEEFHAKQTDYGGTGFSKQPQGNRRGQRMFDQRITMHSDPDDPEGGYRPYFSGGYATSAMTWIKDGILNELAYDPGYAMQRGKPYADLPWSLRLSGGATTFEEMIAQCEEGIFVNRFSNVELLDLKTGLMTGVTRDGCFLIRKGQIERSIKNFRFLDSPFFVLNNLIALGPTHRAAFGYTPPARHESEIEWPRPPMIVPPIMVKDFNFNALADAV